MSTSVSAPSTSTFSIGPFDTIGVTVSPANGAGSFALVSAVGKLRSDANLTAINGTLGPWGAPMTVTLTVANGTVTYNVTRNSISSVAAAALMLGASTPIQISAHTTITATNWATYDGSTIELTGAYNITINAGATAAGLKQLSIMAAAGSAGSLISDGTVTFNGATTTVTLAAGSLTAVVARGSAANQFAVKGS